MYPRKNFLVNLTEFWNNARFTITSTVHCVQRVILIPTCVHRPTSVGLNSYNFYCMSVSVSEIGLYRTLLDLIGKPAKKTTFSLNQTTWSDHASRARHGSGGTESDTQSESSEASTERKQFTDVKILLEEKRKVSINQKLNV